MEEKIFYSQLKPKHISSADSKHVGYLMGVLKKVLKEEEMDEYSIEKLRLTAEHHVAYVARVGDEKTGHIIAFAQIEFKYTPTDFGVHLDNVVTHPEYKRRGIMTELLNRLFDVARKRGANYVRLESNPTRTEALDFYLKKLRGKKIDTNVIEIDI